VSGKGTHVLNDNRYTIEKGDYFIVDYQNYHTYEVIKNEQLKIINLIFSPSFIDKSLQYCDSFNDVANHYLIHFRLPSTIVDLNKMIFNDKNEKIYSLISVMKMEFEEKNDAYFELLRGYLIQLTILTLRTLGKISALTTSPLVSDVLSAIRKDYHMPLHLSDLCIKYFYSEPYVSKKIKQETGLTFSEHLKNTRIEQACRMLINTNLKIYEISSFIGYNNFKYFQELFKIKQGLTPSAYRRKFSNK